MYAQPIEAFFGGHSYFAPNWRSAKDRRALAEELGALLTSEGWMGPGKNQGREKAPRFMDPAQYRWIPDGDLSFARWLWLKPEPAMDFYLAVSTVADIYSVTTNWSPRNVSLGGQEREPVERAVIEDTIRLVAPILEKHGISFVPWDLPELDAIRPVAGRPDATIRELLFNYDEAD